MQQHSCNDNLKIAIGAILAACCALSLGDTIIRLQSASFVIWQIFILRSAIVIPFLIYLARIHSCTDPLLPQQIGWTVLRSLVLVMTWVFYFTALTRIDVAVAAATYYTLPIFINLLAALFLGEKMTARGWLGLTTGFAGTLLILQPDRGDFNAWALLSLLSAFLYAVAMILTRAKCRSERPTVLALWLNVCFLAVGAAALLYRELWPPAVQTVALHPFLLGAWTPMWLGEWRIMGILALAILLGSIFAALAYQRGPASRLAVFDFSYVAFAAVWGYLFFGELPSATAGLGILMIFAACLVSSRQRGRA